jgi:hypothetical protein
VTLTASILELNHATSSVTSLLIPFKIEYPTNWRGIQTYRKRETVSSNILKNMMLWIW